MKSEFRKTRRQILFSFVVGMATLPRSSYLPGSLAYSVSEAVERLVLLGNDSSLARQLGRAVLSTNTESVDYPSLLRSILGDNWQALVSSSDDAALRRFLDSKRREDFSAGRIRRVDGWVLTKCEADFLALTSLA